MVTNIQKINRFLFLSILLIFSSCGNEESTSDCIPGSTINVSINLSLAAYQNLQGVGGWIYYNGELAGSQGLIVVNRGNGAFKAYDRNAPHICPTSNSVLQIESDTKIVCPADGAEWILTTGQPLSVAGRSPITYFTSLSGDILLITN